ncbi:hypothetical protein AB1Y20_004358 [Prymnesium parvum]|uniref:Uncharacterized protein n=1 Tax=Prymnesium parvum TaxID=97485 RepID=A0AB34IW03_PRYPA
MNEPLNVRRRVREEQVLTDRLQSIKETSHAMHASEWHNSRMRTDVLLNQLKTKKAVTAELEQQNKELLLLRRARMRDFLEEEAKEFERQLNAMGLAFCKEF